MNSIPFYDSPTPLHMERRRGEDVRDDDGQIMVWCAVCVWEEIDEDRHSRHFTVIDDLLHPRGSSSSSFFLYESTTAIFNKCTPYFF